MAAIDVVLERLEHVRRAGGGWRARCPAHESDSPSLVVSVGDDGRVLLSCKVGCSTKAVIGELGLEWKDLFDSSGSPPARPHFVPKRVNRKSESSSLARQQIEDDWDAGLLSHAEYLRLLDLWHLGLPDLPRSRVTVEFDEHGEVIDYKLWVPARSEPYVLREEADYLGPGNEPRKLRPPLTRPDFDSDEDYRAYEDWRLEHGAKPV